MVIEFQVGMKLPMCIPQDTSVVVIGVVEFGPLEPVQYFRYVKVNPCLASPPGDLSFSGGDLNF